MADRDILFKIGVIDHEQTGPRLKALADAVRGTMTDVQGSIRNVGSTATTEINRIGKSAGSLKDSLGASGVNVGARASGQGASAVPNYTQQSENLKKFSQENANARVEVGKLAQSLSANSRAILGGVNETAEGIGRMAQGIAFLSAGNEDVKKLVDTLLTIKGTADIFLGFAKSMTSVLSLFSLLGEREKIQIELNTLSGRSADAAAASYLRLASAKAVAAGTTVGGPTVGGAATQAGGQVAATVATQSIGSRIGGLAGRAAAAGGTAVSSIAGLVGPAGAAAAALGSVAVSGKVLQEVFSGTAKQANSVTFAIAKWEVGIVNSIGKMTGWFDLVGDVATENAEKQTLAAIAARQLAEEMARSKGKIQFDARQQARSNQSRIDDVRIATAQEKQQTSLRLQSLSRQDVSLAKELAQANSVIEQSAKGAAISTEDVVIAYDRAKSVTEQIASNQLQQIELVKQEAGARRSMSEEAKRAAQERLATEKETIRTTKEGLLSAQERFAQLSKEDQLRAKRAADQARVDPESLTDAQRSLLRRVGDQSFVTAARRADVAEANRAGFNQFFGSTERGQIAAAQVRAQQAQIQINDQTRFIVDVTRREKVLVDALAKQTISAIQESNRRISAMVKAQIDAHFEQKNRSELQQNQANRAR